MEYKYTQLKKAREEKHLSCTELMFELSKVRNIQVSRQTLLNWETGKTSPKASDLWELAEFYGKRVGYFFVVVLRDV